MKSYSSSFEYKKPGKTLNDGKFTFKDGGKITGYQFPDYIDNDEHPFLFCRSLTLPDQTSPSGISKHFSGSDDATKFAKNKERLGPTWKYYSKEIVYNVNNSGYRTYAWSEINWKDSIVIFGCSNVFGVGVAEDETISYYLEKLTGRPVINLGYPGGSNSAIAHNCAALLDKFETPYAVVIGWSSGDRYQHYFGHSYVDMGPWHHKSVNIQLEPIEGTDLSVAWEQRYLSKYNELCESYWLAKMVKVMCQNTKLASFSYFEHMAHCTRSDFFQGFVPGARDLLHPPAEKHEEVANKIFKLL